MRVQAMRKSSPVKTTETKPETRKELVLSEQCLVEAVESASEAHSALATPREARSLEHF